MRIQTTLNDMLKKLSLHHASIPDWIHDCAEWDDCNILIQKFEQKKVVYGETNNFRRTRY